MKKNYTTGQTDSGSNISIGDVLFVIAILVIIVWTIVDILIRVFLVLTGMRWLWKLCTEGGEDIANMLQSRLAVIRQRN